MFEIEFTAKTGEKVRRKVPDHALARQLAKDLAVASGHRATVRRSKNTSEQRWKMVVFDLETGAWIDGVGQLTANQAIRYWKSWNWSHLSAVAVPWPESLAISPAELSRS